MFSWSELTQQLQQIVDVLIRFIKARRREEASIGLGTLLCWVGYAFSGWLSSELMEFLKPRHGVLIFQIIFWAAGLAFLVYGAVSRLRLMYVPALPPPQDRPSAIKGPMAFTEEDGALFWKLGRANELQTLSGFILDHQVPLVIVSGASGVGKTSLLRAGLTHILANKEVRYHYWEAVPTASSEGLLRAIKENWREKAPNGVDSASHDTAAPIPMRLADLVNPSSALCQEKITSLSSISWNNCAKTMRYSGCYAGLPRKPDRRIGSRGS